MDNESRGELIHPEFEISLVEVDATKLELWFHPDQANGVSGHMIYEKLEADGLLASCLNLSDLMIIQAKGIVFYRQHIAVRLSPAWKSVTGDSDGPHSVPCLFDSDDELVIIWYRLEYNLGLDGPALRRIC